CVGGDDHDHQPRRLLRHGRRHRRRWPGRPGHPVRLPALPGRRDALHRRRPGGAGPAHPNGGELHRPAGGPSPSVAVRQPDRRPGSPPPVERRGQRAAAGGGRGGGRGEGLERPTTGRVLNMKIPSLRFATAVALVLALAAAAGAQGTTVLTVGATPVPHAEILEFVKPALQAEGIELRIVEFTDYVLPNLALAEGELDANYFQHIPYLETFAANHRLNLSVMVGVHIEL